MNADICHQESQKPHPPFFLFCLAHLFYWPGIMVGGVNESGSAPRGTYAQFFFLGTDLVFFSGLIFFRVIFFRAAPRGTSTRNICC